MSEHLDAYKTTGTSPPLQVTVNRMDVTPGSTVGVGHGTDPSGRELSFGADWRCALTIHEALERGEHVKVHLEGWQLLAWRARR